MGQTLMNVRWVGHATTLVEIDGVHVLTDPLLIGSPLRGMVRRRASGLVALEDVVAPDVVLISHAHQDHLHLPSLRLLPEGTLLLVPEGAGRWVERHGFGHVEELAVDGKFDVGAVRVHATFAAHDGTRLPLGPAAVALGYAIEGNERVYFGGDTDLFLEMEDIPRVAGGRLDLALLPVGGWGPTLRGGHMDPDRAAAALRLLRPRVAVPIHWGTFWPRGLARVRPHRFHLPGPAFRDAAALAAPEVDVRVLAPGEALAVVEAD